MALDQRTGDAVNEWKSLHYSKGCPKCEQEKTHGDIVGLPAIVQGVLSPTQFAVVVMLTCTSCGHVTLVSPEIAMKELKPKNPPSE